MKTFCTGILIIAGLVVTGCSPKSDEKKAILPPVRESALSGQPIGNHPLNKFIELVGFRVSEEKEGSVKVQFGLVNHSNADIGDLQLRVVLTTNLAKPSDPPLGEFKVTVKDIGPNEIKDVTGSMPTKLKVYELPDWQFLRAKFEILSPPPDA